MVLKIFKQKKGQQIFIGIMTAVLVFIALVQLINPIKDQVTTARSTMDCTNTDISTGTKGACVIVDWYLPYFLAAGIAVSVGFITQRRYVQVSQ